ncbi:MAG: Nif3-like dinuclear metal center hexameric protein [Nitrospinota bacterium]|nr:Nif3-like dinuclear metal center hexameric protein [Nitrospinota bacterium]
MDILQLTHYLDELLDIQSIEDSPGAFNGLQVENTGEIHKVGLAVDLCLATIEMAIEKNCNMLFVHHGMFWGGPSTVRGKLYQKLALMMRANLGLYSAHIPLDVHPVLGNSKVLADRVNLQHREPFGEYRGIKIGLKGKIERRSSAFLGKELEDKLGTGVKVIGEGEIETVGLVTGGAGDMVHQAVQENLDCYITGEAASHHYHDAIEGGCVMILAGHYATETGGVLSVGRHLNEKFAVKTEFLDYPTGL